MSLQSVFIRDTERRGQQPKTFVVYKVTVNGGVRSWNVWHRYSEFVALHDDLVQHTSAEPPEPLPPKHRLSLFTAMGVSSDESIIEERRLGLETYLRAILSTKESKWRDAFVFKDFLGVPAGRDNTIASSGSNQFTSASWLDEHSDLQTMLRDVRADLNKRDALSKAGSSASDISGAHGANVQAKKKLVAVLSRIDVLARGLQDLALSGMREGEVQRRGDMIARLQDECNNLGKIMVAARQPGARGASGFEGSAAANPAAGADRAALLGGATSRRPVARVFGLKAQPEETDQTRPLDESGLVQLQQVQMDQQDSQLMQLTAILQRQKHLGLAINAEIEQQIELIDGISNDVDRTSSKLGAAQKEMRKLK